MSTDIPSDRTVLDLLRQRNSMTVAEFQVALGVTATAVRQRLNRLLAQGYIEKRKDDTAVGRGRPNHCYGLTAAGRRKTGSNFADLAAVLWEEVRAIPDVHVRRGLIQRIAGRFAALYRDSVQGGDMSEKMQSLANLFDQRQVPFAVEISDGGLPVLTALACPYPDLAEQDRGICAIERMMVSELLGQSVTLDECRLDGDPCCKFALSTARSRGATNVGTTEIQGADPVAG